MGIFSGENPPPKGTRKESATKNPRVPANTYLNEEKRD
jgi:hypothetical protein